MFANKNCFIFSFPQKHYNPITSKVDSHILHNGVIIGQLNISQQAMMNNLDRKEIIAFPQSAPFRYEPR